jgi:hypothetical protein
MKRSLVFSFLGAALLAVLPNLTLASPTQDDRLVVAANNAPLMRGHSTLATLPAGHPFQVIRRDGNWVGTRTTINGRTVSGWLWQGQVTTPQRFAQRQSARRFSYQPAAPVRRFSYVPGAATAYQGPNPYATSTLPPDMRDYVTGGVRSGSPLIIGATKYGPSYWRADRKIIGY